MKEYCLLSKNIFYVCLKFNTMKTLVFIFLLSGLSSFTFAQDTLFTKKGNIIPCIVTEIGIDEIKYKTIDNTDGPNYVARKTDVSKIVYKNGKTEFFLPDEMEMNQEEQILDKNQSIKFAFLSPLYDHLEFVYECKLKMTKNLEIKVGYVGLGNAGILSSYTRQGGYFAGGIKFLLGQDYYIKGMKYAHPLKGSYLKPELILSMIDYQTKNSINNYNNGSFRKSLIGFNIVYGKQYILGNILTFDFHMGVGFGISSTYKVTNTLLRDYSYTRYGGCVYMSDSFPMTLTGGLMIGYIFK